MEMRDEIILSNTIILIFDDGESELQVTDENIVRTDIKYLSIGAIPLIIIIIKYKRKGKVINIKILIFFKELFNPVWFITW